MNESNQKWHSLTLQTYTALMHETLIYPHNITTEGSKAYQFEDEAGLDLQDELRGFFAMKDVSGQKTKYFIEEEYFKELPIRVNRTEEIFYKDSSKSKSIILRPLDITPFRIKPEQCWESNKEFIDSIAPFKHSMPDQWTLNKFVALMGYVGKTFCGVCSLSEFGKSSIYLILDALTKKCPVFQPRSVPGVLAQITGDGNIVFDEVHDAPSEVKSCMENFSLQVAGNSPVYINGAMRSKNTKPKYDVSKQSITYLYNVYSNYSNPEKQFWNFIWSNTKAMESRFLGLKFEGKLEEEFDKNFDIPTVADKNKMFYVKIAKHLLYLKKLKLSNSYNRRYSNNYQLNLQGRHKIIYEEITWMIDLYADNQQEYEKFIILLNNAITGYEDLICVKPTTVSGLDKFQDGTISTNNLPKTNELVEEEFVEDGNEEERVMEAIDNAPDGKIMVEVLLEEAKILEKILKDMLAKGDIFEVRPSIIARF